MHSRPTLPAPVHVRAVLGVHVMPVTLVRGLENVTPLLPPSEHPAPSLNTNSTVVPPVTVWHCTSPVATPTTSVLEPDVKMEAGLHVSSAFSHVWLTVSLALLRHKGLSRLSVAQTSYTQVPLVHTALLDLRTMVTSTQGS